MNAAELVTALRETRGFAHKHDIGGVVAALAHALPGGSAAMDQAVALGDDCAALPEPGGDGYLLLAIEGFVEDFVKAMPWFAGYCGVMVNLSDIYAMGGRPLAVVDALWSDGLAAARPLLQGLAQASAKYGVPIVGGHTNNRSDSGQLAVAVLGRARRLLTSFNARPGDDLLMAIDLRGAYAEPYPFWDASTKAPAERLRGDLEILPTLAELELCDAAKDISMAGAIGTALMLLECSGCGATLELDAIPRPPGIPLLRWLTSFPSFGFVLSARPAQRAEIIQRFAARGLACAVVGQVDASRRVTVRSAGDTALMWDFAADPFIGAQPAQPLQQPGAAAALSTIA